MFICECSCDIVFVVCVILTNKIDAHKLYRRLNVINVWIALYTTVCHHNVNKMVKNLSVHEETEYIVVDREEKTLYLSLSFIHTQKY